MRDALAPLSELGVDVEVRPWEHASLIELQEANLAIELGGPEAVQLNITATEFQLAAASDTIDPAVIGRLRQTTDSFGIIRQNPAQREISIRARQPQVS